MNYHYIAVNHFKLSEEALEKIKGTGEIKQKVEQELDNSLFGDERYSRIDHSFGDSKKLHINLLDHDDRSIAIEHNDLANADENDKYNPSFGKQFSLGLGGFDNR